MRKARNVVQLVGPGEAAQHLPRLEDAHGLRRREAKLPKSSKDQSLRPPPVRSGW